MKNCRYCGDLTDYFAYDVCRKCDGLAMNGPLSNDARALVPCARCGSQVRQGGIHFCPTLWREDVDTGRYDRHVEALRYALSGYRRHGKSEAMRLAEERSKHFNRVADAEVRWLVAQGIPIGDIEMSQHGPLLGDACGQAGLVHKPSQKQLVGFNLNAPNFSPLRYRDRVTAIVAPKSPTLRECLSCLGSVAAHDGAYVAHKNSDGYRCLGSGQVVPDYARHTMPHPKAREPLFTLPTRPHYLGPCECGRAIYGTDADRGRKCEACRETSRKPPTLREWLGDRVSELGPWGDVLREQPVPAVWIGRWEWVMYQGKWHLNAHGKPGTPSGIAEYAIVHAALGTTDRQWFPPWYDDGIVSGCFTRHPDVKPAPRLTIGCEDQYEV